MFYSAINISSVLKFYTRCKNHVSLEHWLCFDVHNQRLLVKWTIERLSLLVEFMCESVLDAEFTCDE